MQRLEFSCAVRAVYIYIYIYIYIQYDISRLRVKLTSMVYPGIFLWRFQQIQLRTEGRENGDLGAVAP
jgi:hypothetical protein